MQNLKSKMEGLNFTILNDKIYSTDVNIEYVDVILAITVVASVHPILPLYQSKLMRRTLRTPHSSSLCETAVTTTLCHSS